MKIHNNILVCVHFVLLLTMPTHTGSINDVIAII